MGLEFIRSNLCHQMRRLTESKDQGKGTIVFGTDAEAPLGFVCSWTMRQRRIVQGKIFPVWSSVGLCPPAHLHHGIFDMSGKYFPEYNLHMPVLMFNAKWNFKQKLLKMIFLWFEVSPHIWQVPTISLRTKMKEHEFGVCNILLNISQEHNWLIYVLRTNWPSFHCSISSVNQPGKGNTLSFASPQES